MKSKNMTTLRIGNSIIRSPLRHGYLFVALALVYFALLPVSRAVLPPPTPDGGYPGFNTAEGDNALFNLTTGTNNTALGANALQSDTTGGADTATGNGALAGNIGGSNNTATGFQALLNNNADNNTANGVNALLTN